jgi:hypothetical protein
MKVLYGKIIGNYRENSIIRITLIFGKVMFYAENVNFELFGF